MSAFLLTFPRAPGFCHSIKVILKQNGRKFIPASQFPYKKKLSRKIVRTFFLLVGLRHRRSCLRNYRQVAVFRSKTMPFETKFKRQRPLDFSTPLFSIPSAFTHLQTVLLNLAQLLENGALGPPLPQFQSGSAHLRAKSKKNMEHFGI